MCTLADLSDAHRAILDAITRVPADLANEPPDDPEDETRFAWVTMGALELACPLDFAVLLSELLALDLVALWEIAGVEPSVTLTPYGAFFCGVTIGERSIKKRDVSINAKHEVKIRTTVIASEVPYWVRPHSPVLRRKIVQPKYAHERPLPFPEEEVDPKSEQGAYVNVETGEVVQSELDASRLFQGERLVGETDAQRAKRGIPVVLDRREARRMKQAGRAAKRKKRRRSA